MPKYIADINPTAWSECMKITFDNNSTNQNVDKAAAAAFRDTRVEKGNQTGAYTFDISGAVMNNTAYKEQGKSAEEVMQDAGQIDIDVQRDYMTVMSSVMSAGDYNRMMEDGYQIGDMDVEEVVTIVDKIKAELIKGGTHVTGYTDQIDEEALEEITGSEAFARELSKQFAEHDIPLTEENIRGAMKAYDKASEIQKLTEGTVKYMVENHVEPTIDNLYLAGYSSADNGGRQGRGYYADSSGYYARKADEYHWQQLRPQMERVLQEAGLEVNEETFGDAKWLVENGIPLTPETAADLYRLDTLSFPQDDEQILSAIAAAIADGRRAGEADLTDGRSDWEKAASYVERFARLTDEAVDRTAAEGQELTLSNIEEVQEKMKEPLPAKDTAEDRAAAEPVENITARRQLEEIRLMMTVEANRKLLESGYAIDTTELEQLVEALKQIETQQRQLMFGEPDVDRAAEKAALYAQTQNKIAEIPYLPIDVVGRFKVTDEDFTLNQVHIDGTALRNRYEQAKETYESWMTDTRSDLGDSIQKAFRNVDDILEDLGLEVSEANRRAVRILGYNQMELSPENIQAVRESDMEFRRVISKMTPAAVLQTIRDGRNPLEMTIPEFHEYLDSQQYAKEQEAEKYSKFLYKLEKSGEISEEERTAYIGIYRMLRQFEKTDDAAVGALINTGAEYSFRNLLGAVRTQKKTGMNYVIDDAFAGIEAIEKSMSITTQIESGFRRYYRDIAGDTADRMAQQDASVKEAYQQEQLQECRQACEVEDAVIEELLHNRQPVTIYNLAAADMLMNARGMLYQKLNAYAAPASKGKVKEAMHHLQEAMTDKESAQEAYEEMQRVYEDVLEEAQYDADISYVDLKAIRSCHKQLALAGNLAKEENYQIPVEINGETTAIHLRILHGSEDGGKVKVTLETKAYGKVAAEFSVNNRKISGYIACSAAEGTEAVRSKKDSLLENLKDTVEALEREELELGEVGVIHSHELDLNSFTAEEEPNTSSSVQTAALYQIAKSFITVITA